MGVFKKIYYLGTRINHKTKFYDTLEEAFNDKSINIKDLELQMIKEACCPETFEHDTREKAAQCYNRYVHRWEQILI